MRNNVHWSYQPICESVFDPELGKYDTYGIRASRKTPEGWELIEFIHDVTTEKELVKKMARLFNIHQLSPIHLREVLIDMLP